MADYLEEKPEPDTNTCLRTKVIEGKVMWAKEGQHYYRWDGGSQRLVCGACGRIELVENHRGS